MSLPSSSAFAPPLLHPLQLRTDRAKCSRHPTPLYVRRTLPVAQNIPFRTIRRGPKPNPVIPDTLFEAKPAKDIDFNDVDFSSIKGCVTYVVNVASSDDYTESNYALMKRLLENYYDDGLRIVAYPSNWYGQKETGTHEEIKAFVHQHCSDKVILMAKSDLEWSQVFALGTKYFPGDIVWNFHGKFVFNRSGIPIARFDLLTEDATIEACIQKALSERPSEEPPQQPVEP